MAKLYSYQQRVYDALMRGKNVILQAPTGSGKTLAALYPFLENLDRYGLDQKESVATPAPLPLTCRYAVPMRVLASQFEREYQDYILRLDSARGTQLRKRYTDGLGVPVPAIQTGESPHDRAFESPLTFCTIDQLLSSFIGSPYSLGGRQANLNVGAVAGSYLVLDEYHLYPLEKGGGARTTTLAMLRLLKGLCRFVLMTATFSSRLLDELGEALDAEVVRVTDAADLAEIMGSRSRTMRVSASAMTAQVILSAHVIACERRAGASLVVCNTVARAQEMYEQLRGELAGVRASGLSEAPGETRLVLLHSRFTQMDRQRKREQLEAWLGKDNWVDGEYQGPSTIVVATQVVEVGLNISAGALHTELAPANSVIQRAGRCARFAGQRGEVIVYHPLASVSEAGGETPLAELGALAEEDARKKAANVPYLPYDRATCDATWRELVERCEACGDAPAPFGFAEEQALIDAVHTQADATMIEMFRRTGDQIEDVVKHSLTTHEMGAGAELIRDVVNVSVIIHDDPERITTRPYDWDAFSLRPGTLLKDWEALYVRKEALQLPWVMMTMEPEVSPREEDDNSREPRYRWKVVSHEARGSQITGALRLALPSALATYDDELGFRLLLDDAASSSGWVSQSNGAAASTTNTFGGKQGSYVEHIAGLMRAYNYSVRRELLWVSQRLESGLGLEPGSVDAAVRLAIACHDIGKLARDWQTWAHAWQAALVERFGAQYAVQPGRAFLAKTDRPQNGSDERLLRRELRVKRPNHSCVGVVAARDLIARRLLENSADPSRVLPLARAIWSAIARHHAPTAREYDMAAWDPEAREIIGQALAVCGLPATPEWLGLLALDMTQAGELPQDWLVEPVFDRDSMGDTPTLTTWLGFVIVRALRLCDQRAERNLA